MSYTSTKPHHEPSNFTQSVQSAAAGPQMQATLRRRILRAFVGRRLLQRCDGKDTLAYQHSEPDLAPTGTATLLRWHRTRPCWLR